MKEANKCTMWNIMKTANYSALLFIFSFCFFGCVTNNNSVQNRNPVQRERRFYEVSGGFSIVPPETWQITDAIPGTQYKSLIGQWENGHAPGITFVTETFNGQLNDFIDVVYEILKSTLGENISIIQRSDFVTLKNVKGEKIITHYTMYGRNFRQFIYCFHGKNDVFLLVTCTALAETSYGYYNELFDRTVKTFEWIYPHDNPVQRERRFYVESGGFSIVPPETWQIDKEPGAYISIREQRENGFAQNMVFSTETFYGQLNEYVDNTLEILNLLYGRDISLIQRSDFVTLKNVKGEKFIFNRSIHGGNIQQITYCLPGKDNIFIIIVCTVLVNYDYYNGIFDRTVETFEWTYP
jgi:hypothetical protein